MLLLLPVAYLLAAGRWWALIIPLATAVPVIGITPAIVYPVAFWVASGIFAVGAVLVAALIRPIRVPAGEPRLEPAPGRA